MFICKENDFVLTAVVKGSVIATEGVEIRLNVVVTWDEMSEDQDGHKELIARIKSNIAKQYHESLYYVSELLWTFDFGDEKYTWDLLAQQYKTEEQEDKDEDEDDEYDVDWYEDEIPNMPCDTYGPAACSSSCPKYFKCQCN